MKFLIFFTILVSAVACALACNPDGSNEPTCDESNVEKPIRNFWNPNNYWLCKEAGGKANSLTCPDAQGFDESKGECVPFSEIQWIEPCSGASAKPVTELVTEPNAETETEPDIQSVSEHDAKDGADTDANKPNPEPSDETNKSDSKESVSESNTTALDCEEEKD